MRSALSAIVLVGVLAVVSSAPGGRGEGEKDKDAQIVQPGELRRVEVAVLYENITDGLLIDRSLRDTIAIFRETRADLVFRCFWKWMPVVDSPDEIPPELLELAPGISGIEQAAAGLRRSGHYYQALKKAIAAIREELPDLVLIGAIPAQTLARIEYNPLSGKVYTAEETWAMALDPQKWDITYKGRAVTKLEFQARLYASHPYGGVEERYDPTKAQAYFPDITNPKFRELLVSWAGKQIDCGVDGIWIDMLYTQAAILAKMTGDPAHPAVRDSVKAAREVVEAIHRYGRDRGKYVYVGSWIGPFVASGLGGNAFPYSPPAVDFVTWSVTSAEILNRRVDTQRWEKLLAAVRDKYGAIPVFAFIDWSFDESPMVTFSQRLTRQEQIEALRQFDEALTRLGVVFVYPLHGGYMGRGEVTTKLAFGKYRVYDALAPEFDTYQAIVELARRKGQ